MLRISAKTKMSPQEAIKHAVAFFGPEGYGLEIQEESADRTYLVGGGGGVVVTANKEGKETNVELVSREWDYQTKEFINKIK